MGEHAESVGTKVYLEPLNRFEDFVINQLADAVSVVEEVGSPGVMITADTFHMSIEEARIGESIRRAGGLIGHVQLGTATGWSLVPVTTTGSRPWKHWTRSAMTAGWQWNAV